ncbi:NTE family protein RssA [Clostridium tepidiprofundi DSM 19306]|uniref:NTE family protein RssA n=1 Tax=Clostridium tepidiprofundi DSM 19306 TaxID=1121338 RepID=A0A151B5R5_9CLOT|nr:patatin family protein [Clostridium tepidiprofundi]KYH34997.1 NTE family protein RssA [Clostridium tepidiprofundi DSM 19306]
MNNIGLVLEGGGMRGVYTSGVLDYFMDENLYFPYVIGVSMGACNAASYISKQRGRNKIVNIEYVNDKRYLSYRGLLRDKSLFGMDFIFDYIPNNLTPFDFDTYINSEQKFIIVTTDCETGKPVYFNKDDDVDTLKIIRASSSLPFISQIVEIKGKKLLDGGITDSIPVKKAIEDGNEKLVVVLTRDSEYIKKPFKMKRLAKRVYSKYPNLVNAMLERHIMYNNTLEYIRELESQGKAFVIRPSHPLNVGRVERNQDKLRKLYEMGYEEAKACGSKLKEFL